MTPAEFVEELRGSIGPRYVDRVTDDVLDRHTLDKLKEHGAIKSDEDALDDGLAFPLKQLLDAILGKLPPDKADEIRRKVAFGVADTGSINAAIYRHSDGFFAIMLNRGLMLYLHKAGKIAVGMSEPSAVSYSTKFGKRPHTLEQLQEIYLELLETTQKNAAPWGGKIILSDEMMMPHSTMLLFAEMFVICHELGHFWNGDLDSRYEARALSATIQELTLSPDHRIEFKADAVAFEHFLVASEELSQGLPLDFKLCALFTLFDHLLVLGGGASSTHPHPICRALLLAFAGGGPSMADKWVRSYEGRALPEEVAYYRQFVDSLSTAAANIGK
jgi:hypothetical protein